jgi:hypothetical protein
MMEGKALILGPDFKVRVDDETAGLLEQGR